MKIKMFSEYRDMMIIGACVFAFACIVYGSVMCCFREDDDDNFIEV
jgi:hypothetical protein